MGTSATIRFKHKEDNSILVNVYHHYDGYVEGVGHDLAEFLLSKKIVNGITAFDDMNAIANGFSCLIAQYISYVKEGPGDVYIYPQYVKGDYNYDVVYNGYKNEIYIKVTHYDKVLFEGSPKELLEYKDKESEEEEINTADVELVIKLPKGHGKIVDLGKIDKDRIEKDNPIIYLTVNGEYIEAVSLDYLNSLPVIIEADKEVNKE